MDGRMEYLPGPRAMLIAWSGHKYLNLILRVLKVNTSQLAHKQINKSDIFFEKEVKTLIPGLGMHQKIHSLPFYPTYKGLTKDTFEVTRLHIQTQQ
jgi:hypothetical protein